ncbi:hypothetical protein OG455_00850 [Kitasatospora sp. NBC_01287]|uniref:hypothetical protein n=1 Tax=Kitasatospora sp. NBC_01287 TaxID=2903573 RepID=UPI00225A1D97|nr:hypothetical protein [Kitasatospora sp. NBC_01287]MCX4744073.1 hypothetical protein [Kitasatospora sp. NBC_01287]
MRVLVGGEVHVHYSQLYVESDAEKFTPLLEEAFAGQAAGLCGGAQAGALFLSTGLHTGNVGFTVELHELRPPVDDGWEEVVEVPFTPASERTVLMQWAGEACWELDLVETDYRARYCARGMDRARAADTRGEGEPQLDQYLLQLWPSPPAPARVLKQTSEIAAYWHNYARELPAPPTPEERAEALRLAPAPEPGPGPQGRPVTGGGRPVTVPGGVLRMVPVPAERPEEQPEEPGSGADAS